MPFNGAGSFVSLAAPIFPAVPATTIASSYFNANMEDLFDGLTNCLTRDGQSPALANIPMGTFQLTNLGTPTLAGMALVFGQRVPVADGTVLLPGLVFASDLDTGFYKTTADQWQFAAAGVAVGYINKDQLAWGSGTVALPTHSFSSDPDTGMYSSAANTMGFAAGGSLVMSLSASGFVGTQSNTGTYGIDVTNSSTGVNAAGGMIARNSSGALGELIFTSTAFTGLALAGTSALLMYANGANGLAFAADNATATIRWSVGGPTESMRLNTNGLGIGGAAASAERLRVQAVDDARLILDGTGSGVGSGGQLLWYRTSVFAGSIGIQANRLGDSSSNIMMQSVSDFRIYTGAGSGTFRSRWTSAGSFMDANDREYGWKNIPRNTAYGSLGQCSSISADITVSTGTVEDTISIYNNSAAAINLLQGGGLTFRLAGTTATGNRVLAARGWCTLWWQASNECIASGAGLS